MLRRGLPLQLPKHSDKGANGSARNIPMVCQGGWVTPIYAVLVHTSSDRATVYVHGHVTLVLTDVWQGRCAAGGVLGGVP